MGHIVKISLVLKLIAMLIVVALELLVLMPTQHVPVATTVLIITTIATELPMHQEGNLIVGVEHGVPLSLLVIQGMGRNVWDKIMGAVAQII